ncbi:hypothetical protein [Photobacterium minamisatsumaniensis]|uniref:hypothetical protein n=1 Tax=Photobacterium minamisatsumaniensis TaxID=2910233 RepID=UPI003D0E1CF7
MDNLKLSRQNRLYEDAINYFKEESTRIEIAKFLKISRTNFNKWGRILGGEQNNLKQKDRVS